MSLLTLAPMAYQTVETTAGASISAGLVYTYLTGTSTPVTTWQDSGGATPNANPILADSAGRFTAFLTPGVSYRFSFATALGVIFKTVDGIAAVPVSAGTFDTIGVAGEALTAGNTGGVYLSDGSGSKTAGKWYMWDADFPYASTSPIVGMVTSDIAINASGTIRIGGQVTGLSGLTAGTSYYISATAGSLTATAPGNARFVGVADSTSSIVLVPSTAAAAQNTEITATAGETITAGQSVYISDGSNALTAGRIYLADADFVYASSQAVIVGIAPNAIASGAAGVVRIGGRLTALTSLTAGLSYFISATAGGLTATPPANRRLLGVADSTTSLLLQTAGSVDVPTMYCAVSNSAAQSIPNTTETILLFDTEEADTNGIHSIVSATGRMTIPTLGGGTWLFTAKIYFASAINTLFECYARKNGTNVSMIRHSETATMGAEALTVTFMLTGLVATDYIEVIAYVNAAGAVNSGSGTAVSKNFYTALKVA